MTQPARCRDGRCVRMSPGLCGPCSGRLAGWLADLPALYVRLTLNTGRTTGTGEPVSGSRDLPVPVRLDVIDHLTLIGDQLGSWARMIAEQRDFAGPTEAPPFRFLAIQQEWAARQPWADDWAVEVHDLWRTARALAGDHARRVRIGSCITDLADGPCGETLYAQAGASVIRCRGCGADWTRGLWLLLGAAIDNMAEEMTA